MAIHNIPGRELMYKIAYHGPGMCGKTTNLRFIFNTLPGRQVGNLLVLDTAVERTLYYDFLPLVIPLEDDYKVRFHLYTVPGQAYYEASRKLVLKGVDCVIFVADSRAERLEDNLQSLEMLKKDLGGVGLEFEKMPLIVQNNKRDLPDLSSPEEIADKLGTRGIKSIDAVARDGIGVFETLSAAAKLLTGNS